MKTKMLTGNMIATTERNDNETQGNITILSNSCNKS